MAQRRGAGPGFRTGPKLNYGLARKPENVAGEAWRSGLVVGNRGPGGPPPPPRAALSGAEIAAELRPHAHARESWPAAARKLRAAGAALRRVRCARACARGRLCALRGARAAMARGAGCGTRRAGAGLTRPGSGAGRPGLARSSSSWGAGWPGPGGGTGQARGGGRYPGGGLGRGAGWWVGQLEGGSAGGWVSWRVGQLTGEGFSNMPFQRGIPRASEREDQRAVDHVDRLHDRQANVDLPGNREPDGDDGGLAHQRSLFSWPVARW
jgi:hypothetical protein